MLHRDRHRKKPAWERPSPRVRALIRRGAELALAAPPAWLEEIDAATLATEAMLAGDPDLAAATRRTNRANLLHWAAANVEDPGAPVAPNLGPEPLAIARDLVRRGAGASALQAYRAGQNAAWLRWMEIAFQLTSEPAELRELLDVSARSINAFVDATVAGIAERMEAERDELTRGTHAERREVVALLLEGAPLTQTQATRRLGYDVTAPQRAAVIWSDRRATVEQLEAAAAALARLAGSPPTLGVVASSATLWFWMAGGALPGIAALERTLRLPDGVRVALGPPGRGVEGFRQSHRDALTAQRFAARLGEVPRLLDFDMVRVVALASHDHDAAEELVQHALGRLATAKDRALRDALRVFLAEGANASAAAARLGIHRNTLLRRLMRAEALLPRPLAEDRLAVAVGLELVRWRPR